eukprot:scaffold6781_cov204-Amphora_coffeaeformis.AAC.21
MAANGVVSFEDQEKGHDEGDGEMRGCSIPVLGCYGIPYHTLPFIHPSIKKLREEVSRITAFHSMWWTRSGMNVRGTKYDAIKHVSLFQSRVTPHDSPDVRQVRSNNNKQRSIEEEKMTKASKCTKFKKAPMAPKRFKSAYMFFSSRQHKIVRQRFCGDAKKLRTSEVAKMVSQSWKNLSDDERCKWHELARLDRERYEREKEAYKGPWKVPNVKDPDVPKKPVSAFMAFGNERRKEVAANNPMLSGTDISSLLSKLWKECPAEIRQVYIGKECKQREVYKEKKAEWERRNGEESVEAPVPTDDTTATSLEKCTTVSVGSVGSPTCIDHIPNDDMTDYLTLNEIPNEDAADDLDVFDLDFDAKIPVGTTGEMLLNLSDLRLKTTQELPICAPSPMEAQTWSSMLEPRPISTGEHNEPIGFQGDYDHLTFPWYRWGETRVSLPHHHHHHQNGRLNLEECYSLNDLLDTDELFE